MANSGGNWITYKGRRIYIGGKKSGSSTSKGKDADYELYKKAKEKPDSIDPMTENSTDWEGLDKKYGEKYKNEKSKSLNKESSKGVKNLSGELEKDNKGRVVSQEEYDAFRQAYKDGKISQEDYRNDNYDALKNTQKEINKEKADYAKKKAEEYRNTKDPMFQDIKEQRAKEYEKQAKEYEKQADEEIRKMGMDPDTYSSDAREDIKYNLKSEAKTKQQLSDLGYNAKGGEEITYIDKETGKTSTVKTGAFGDGKIYYLKNKDDFVFQEIDINDVVPKVEISPKILENSKEIRELAKKTGKSSLNSEAERRWNELYKENRNNIAQDLGDNYVIGTHYSGDLNIHSSHPYNETKYSWAKANYENGEIKNWDVIIPGASTQTVNNATEALGTMKKADEWINSGEKMSNYEGIKSTGKPKVSYEEFINPKKSNDWVKNAFNQYKKDHPGTNLTIQDFIKKNK